MSTQSINVESSAVSVSDTRADAAPSRARRICLAAFGLALGLYVASPFATLWTIASAVSNHDMIALGHTINWSSLDASLKEQVLDGFHLAHTTEATEELPEFGASFATTVVSNAVDLNVNQKNLGAVLDQALASSPEAVKSVSLLSALAHTAFRFTSANSFEAQLVLPGHEKQTPLRVQLRIERWQWKLTGVSLPTTRPRLMEASLSRHRA